MPNGNIFGAEVESWNGMKIRESGMPDEEQWEKFFEPLKILGRLCIDRAVRDVVEFGCGYGTFTIPTAQIISGKIFAIDIEPQMIKRVQEKVDRLHLRNVVIIQRDFMAKGSGLSGESADFVMLFNILHLENPTCLLKEALRILRKGGKVGIIHWNYDSSTPRGPPMDIRPKPEQIRKWAESVGFTFEKQLDLKPYHYALILRK